LLIKKREDYSFALLIINLDSFKLIIESLGYGEAESVIKSIARKLTKWEKGVNIAARLGGDEFAVIIEDISNAAKAVEYAKGLKRLITRPIMVRTHNITLTVSIGIAIGNADIRNPEELLQNASVAIYRAKRNGKNRIEIFDQQMHQKALAKLRVHDDLNNAITSGELIVYYQPVFSLKDMRLKGFEALARWNHPVKGLLGPGHFIKIAEETGLIHALDTYILGSVCRQLAAWKINKMPLAWVSVNISAYQFKQDSLVKDIITLITEAGADPRRLVVEITEGTAAESPGRAFRMMQELKEHGIRIALDDFGTGYSSMSYLKKFSIDSLKLDKSFIDGLPENQEDAAIATTIINMAKSLGMKVIAEGVENERQAMFLRSRECDEVQGFLYGKPMPAKKATQLLKRG
jgi:diguanylate cyclase (GGDEF)-like protein